MLHIESLQAKEFQLLLDTMQKQAWNLEIVHLESLFITYPHDFFIAKKDNTVVGFISALRYNDRLGLISNFIILPKFRSLGYGKELFVFACAYLKERQITLECQKNQESFYASFSFMTYYDSITYTMTLSESYSTSHNVSSYYNKNKLLLHHKENLPATYIQHLHTVISNPQTLFRALYKEDRLSAYVIAISYLDGYKIVIESMNNEDTLLVFQALASHLPKGVKIYMEVTELEDLLIRLVHTLKMKEYARMSKMYNKVL